MNTREIENLLQLLRAYGVNHFKTGEMEIQFGVSSPPEQFTTIGPPPPSSIVKGPPTAAAAPPVAMEIPHHVNEVAALLKLSNEELVDRMFPEGPSPMDMVE